MTKQVEVRKKRRCASRHALRRQCFPVDTCTGSAM